MDLFEGLKNLAVKQYTYIKQYTYKALIRSPGGERTSAGMWQHFKISGKRGSFLFL